MGGGRVNSFTLAFPSRIMKEYVLKETGRKLLDGASQSKEVISALPGHTDYQVTINKICLLLL